MSGLEVLVVVVTGVELELLPPQPQSKQRMVTAIPHRARFTFPSLLMVAIDEGPSGAMRAPEE